MFVHLFIRNYCNSVFRSDYSPFPVHHSPNDTHNDCSGDDDEVEARGYEEDDDESVTLMERSVTDSQSDDSSDFDEYGSAVYETEIKRDCDNYGAKRYVSKVHIALHVPVIAKSSSTSCVRYSRIRSPVQYTSQGVSPLRAHSASPFAGNHNHNHQYHHQQTPSYQYNHSPYQNRPFIDPYKCFFINNPSLINKYEKILARSNTAFLNPPKLCSY